MSYGLYDQRDIQNASMRAKNAARIGGSSVKFAMVADRPRRLDQGPLSGTEQVLATALVLIMLVATGFAWNFAPLAGALLGALGVYFVSRRVAAFSSTPLRLRPFFRSLHQTVPTYALLTSVLVVGLSVLYRSVVLEWIPEWIRSFVTLAASGILVAWLTLVPVLVARRAVRSHRARLADEAETESALATVLGANPRSLFEPSPYTGLTAASYFYGSDGSIVVTPQPDVDLSSVADRLARTRLGQRYEVADADYEQIVLVPISAQTLASQETLRSSGGLYNRSDDLSSTDGSTPVALSDNPWADSEVVESPVDTATGDPFTFGSETWK